MFLLDDISLSPVKGVAVVFHKVDDAARQDIASRENAAMAALSELHHQLETSEIDDREFDREEIRLLAQIESLQRMLNPHRAHGDS
jgi:hypothetical protein